MKKEMKTILAALLALTFLGAAPKAFSQNDISTKNVPSLELNQADVRDALRALFKNMGASYSIAPDVQGTVTVSLKNVSFEAALQNVLKQVDATYRIEGGVFQIIRREPEGIPTISGGNLTGVQVGSNKVIRRLKIRHADPEFIFRMISGSPNVSGSAPEISSLSGGGAGGGGGVGGGFGNSGAGGGSNRFGSGSTGGGTGRGNTGGGSRGF